MQLVIYIIRFYLLIITIIKIGINIKNVEAFSSEMEDFMNIENEIGYDRINFEDLNLQTARVKDLIKLEFLAINTY